MHISEEHRKEAEKSHLNVVVAGHISSDNLGLNLLHRRDIERQSPRNSRMLRLQKIQSTSKNRLNEL